MVAKCPLVLKLSGRNTWCSSVLVAKYLDGRKSWWWNVVVLESLCGLKVDWSKVSGGGMSSWCIVIVANRVVVQCLVAETIVVGRLSLKIPIWFNNFICFRCYYVKAGLN